MNEEEKNKIVKGMLKYLLDSMVADGHIVLSHIKPEDVRANGMHAFLQADVTGAFVVYILACAEAVASGGFTNAEKELEHALFESGNKNDSLGFVDYNALVRETLKTFLDILGNERMEYGITVTRLRLFGDIARDILSSIMNHLCIEIEEFCTDGHLTPTGAINMLDGKIYDMREVAKQTLNMVIVKRAGLNGEQGRNAVDRIKELYDSLVLNISEEITKFGSDGENQKFGDVSGRIMELVSIWSFVAAAVNSGFVGLSNLEKSNSILVGCGASEDFIQKYLEESEDDDSDSISVNDAATALMELFGIDADSMSPGDVVDAIKNQTTSSRDIVDELRRLINDSDLGLTPDDFGL